MRPSRAMLLESPGSPLTPATIDPPDPGPEEVVVRVRACAVCRTDLHIVDGELAPHRLPLVPGHEIVGTIVAAGTRVESARIGERVGIPWLAGTCRECEYCTSGRENLCPRARFTGYDIDGGYAEHTVADARYCHTLPDGIDDVSAAPLLCAGLIGYRAYRAAGEGLDLGFYGFGAAAHLIAQVAVADGRRVHAFTRPGDRAGQAFARELGATWAGGSDEMPPGSLHAAIIFAPVGALVPAALRATRPGGTVVCAGIHMSDIPSFPYEVLWGERVVRSVANLTREDGTRFLELAARTPIRIETCPYPLEDANVALSDLRAGRLQGAAVLVP
ncbi:MAG TPA: zinc-dependent alcohol dehydrogenase family protein [Gemmatimonadaceae bacterium]|nr:zinc-dependent alcohol dehydrogenase family protein [Gemmatimonadaceae bacterium]